MEMNEKLMKLDERKRNFPPIITVDESLMMNRIQQEKRSIGE